MKTIATIFFILFIGTTLQAQKNTTEEKVETMEMTIVTKIVNSTDFKTNTEVARLYKFKNARVTKALSFTTKRNKAKMA
ncbi:hypothetical protein [Maribacter thermophilus]|uniref:hypothetical protein n=1 Tax=Maribacter thermophilus TaxID=1197874 RepID=UPI00064177AC|nr:hypothetical protein [Maribacter thermophilus]